MVSYVEQNALCPICTHVECHFHPSYYKRHPRPANNIYDIPVKSKKVRGRFSEDSQAKIYSLKYKFWFFTWFYKWETYYADETKKSTILTDKNLVEWRYL